MNTLNFICLLFLTLLIPATLFASSLRLFFSSDELSEMGVHLETSEKEGERCPVTRVRDP